jgi:hypothetical protein
MRIKYFVLLATVVCLVMPHGVLGGAPPSGIHVTHVPKSKLSLYLKAVGGFNYNAKTNSWRSSEPKDHPVVFKPEFIGRHKLPAYVEGGNMMADPCYNSYYIITDQSYAIRIFTDCYGGSEDKLRKYVSTYSLPKGVHAVRAMEKPDWEVIE